MMKKLVVLIYIAAATLLFGYANAESSYGSSVPSDGSKWNKAVIDFPVHFESITVKRVNDKAEITWSTLSEKNNKQFEVQRSTDGENFKTIAIVFTLEDSNEIKHYTFKDELKGIKESTIFYRIKQVDTAMGYTYSKTVSPS